MKNLFISIRNNDLFELFVVSIILSSAILVGFRTYEESINPEMFFYLSYLDYWFTGVRFHDPDDSLSDAGS